MTTDRIEVHDLLVRCIVGINPEERVKKQDVIINLTLFGDLRRAGQSDDIEDAINYKTLTKRVLDHVEESEYFLVEKMAHKIAEIAVQDFGIQRAIVSVEKPGALRFARSVGVVVERTPADFA
ncbi:MAG TPA: dihydroneopterin aldolase [Anaerolineae bacterium]|nr:dihydroneopterin aldolase [Anaerolineae bacterium]